jgi:hypothetical protein
MDMVAQIEMNGDATIAGLAATVRALWLKVCQHDGADPASMFVVFSESNPYVVLHQNALGQLREAIEARRNLGYVGLQMIGGRARVPERKRQGRRKAAH